MYTNGKMIRQGDSKSIAMPINTSRFVKTDGPVRKPFLTQNLLQKKDGMRFALKRVRWYFKGIGSTNNE